VALGQVFPQVLRFPPVSFIPPVLHYMEKLSKKNLLIFITGVAQEALRLRCVRSICCGALHHKKKTQPTDSTPQVYHRPYRRLSLTLHPAASVHSAFSLTPIPNTSFHPIPLSTEFFLTKVFRASLVSLSQLHSQPI
jgi:hypothetical protein